MCEDDRPPSRDTLSVDTTQEQVKADSETQVRKIKCVKCKRKIDKNECIVCSGKYGKEFHGDCVLSEEEKDKYFVRKSVDNWYCCDCVQFLQGAIKWGNMIGWDEISLNQFKAGFNLQRDPVLEAQHLRSTQRQSWKRFYHGIRQIAQ